MLCVNYHVIIMKMNIIFQKKTFKKNNLGPFPLGPQEEWGGGRSKANTGPKRPRPGRPPIDSSDRRDGKTKRPAVSLNGPQGCGGIRNGRGVIVGEHCLHL